MGTNLLRRRIAEQAREQSTIRYAALENKFRKLPSPKSPRNDKRVHNLSSKELTKVLRHEASFNTADAKPVNMITAVESILCQTEATKETKNLIRHQVSSLLMAHRPREVLSKVERDALRELKADKDLVIVPADKGRATVVLDRTDYLQKAKGSLEDRHFYVTCAEHAAALKLRLIRRDPVTHLNSIRPKFSQEVTTEYSKYGPSSNKDDLAVNRGPTSAPAVSHGETERQSPASTQGKVPIHNQTIRFVNESSSVCIPEKSLERNLDAVGEVKSAVYNFADLDRIRRDFAKKKQREPEFHMAILLSVRLPRSSGGRFFRRDGVYISLPDQGNLTVKCKERLKTYFKELDDVEADEVMVSFDVVSLFTSIPPTLAIDTIDSFLREKYDETDQQLKRVHIIELLEQCLKTFFTFNGQVYEQKKGETDGLASMWINCRSGFAEA
nr:unnamed protein product [Spirometra erinaceieuropaei]